MRKVSPKSLENAALFYLERYAASQAQLRRVLRRKAQRANRAHPEAPVDPEPLIDALLERLTRLGYLDDVRLATSKSAAMRRAGKSTRVIRQALQLKGLVAQLDPGDDANAVWVYARKKRLGPYSKAPAPRDRAVRAKQLAALARAGFAFGLARQVVDAQHPPPDLGL